MAIRMVRFGMRRLWVVPVVALLASACGGDGPTPPAVAASVSVAPDTPLLFTRVGDTITVTASPKDASGNTVNAPVTFTSSDPAVATVSGSGTTGIIVSRGVGTATITVSAAGAPDKTLQVRVGYNVNSNQTCTNLDIRIPRVELQSAHLIIASDVNNPPNGFTMADYQYFADTFESLVWPVLTQNFGMPSDVDKNGKVIAFFTRAVNELTEPNSNSVVGGFFFGRDLFPKKDAPGFGGCVGSNVGEMFYMLVPDPSGVVNQNQRTLAQVRATTVGVMGHEMQHLINSGRRLYVNTNARYPEVSYMEEGLSHIAEELLFYAAAERSPRSNFSRATVPFSNPPTTPQAEALLSYMRSNLSRLSTYLTSPHDDSPYQSDDDLATRGASWSWLRYLADHETTSPASIPACAQPASLPVGGYCGIEGAAAAQFGVAAGGSAGEFTIVAFADGANVQTSASASPAVSVTGPPNPSVASNDPSFTNAIRGSAAMLPLDVEFHGRLRALERRDLPQRVAGARALFGTAATGGARMQLAPPSGSSRVVVTVENVWSRLVNSNDTGMTNLRAIFGTDVPQHTRDWAVANYTDDAGLSVPVQFTHPSWNFRDILLIFSANTSYPLEVRVLSGSAQQLSMVNGGAAYWRLGVAAGSTSTVTFTTNGSAPPANLKLVLVRTK